jgi:hypothetical protein
MHRTSTRFWASFAELPKAAQKTARENFEVLKANSGHPSLHFKKVGKLWAARAGRRHRALAVEDGQDFVWVWIGPHDEYERMIGQQG